MAIGELTGEWDGYVTAFRRFDESRLRLVDGNEVAEADVDAADEALSDVATWSERISDTGAILLQAMASETSDQSTREREQLETFLLSVAAVDFAIACETLLLPPDPVQPDPEIVPAPRTSGVISARALSEDVDDRPFGTRIFAGGAAIDPDRARLLDDCESAFDGLIESAYDPARDFGLGVSSAGFALLPGVIRLDLLGDLNRLRECAGRLKRHAVRLLAAGLRKFLSVSGASSSWLARQAATFLSAGALEAARQKAKSAFKDLLGRSAGRTAAEQTAQQAILGAQQPTQRTCIEVEYALSRLGRAYAEQMKWAGRAESLISHSAPLISTLGAPIGGPILVVALEGVGLGFVVGSLRLSTTGFLLGRAGEGVVTIVQSRI